MAKMALGSYAKTPLKTGAGPRSLETGRSAALAIDRSRYAGLTIVDIALDQSFGSLQTISEVSEIRVFRATRNAEQSHETSLSIADEGQKIRNIVEQLSNQTRRIHPEPTDELQ
jgi:hypothetical protein